MWPFWWPGVGLSMVLINAIRLLAMLMVALLLACYHFMFDTKSADNGGSY